MARTQALDTAANNLANAKTNGFRAERDFIFGGILEDVLRRRIRSWASQVRGSVNGFGRAGRKSSRFQPGRFSKTGNPLDVALRGTDSVRSRPPAQPYIRGTARSRCRRADTVLQSAQGEPVLDTKGKTITIPSGAVSISADGNISVATESGSGLWDRSGSSNLTISPCCMQPHGEGSCRPMPVRSLRPRAL